MMSVSKKHYFFKDFQDWDPFKLNMNITQIQFEAIWSALLRCRAMDSSALTLSICLAKRHLSDEDN